MRIDDNLLEALADRWPHIVPDWPGQTFEVWLLGKLAIYNEYSYPIDGEAGSLWDLVQVIPPASPDEFVLRKADEIREIGGTFVQRVWDLRPLAEWMLTAGV